MKTPFLDALRSRLLVFDGGMGTMIHKVPLTIEQDYCNCENCTDILAVTRPDVIGNIHHAYLEAGADVVETDSFGSNRLVLVEFGIADRAYEISRAAASVARDAAARFSTRDKPRFVAGSMGPGTRLITLGNTTWDDMLASYREQAQGLIDGGADALIIETCQDLLQVKCAINAAMQALASRDRTPEQIPILVSVTIESTGTMLLGTSIEAAAAALAKYPIASLGINCATGPVEMAEHVKWLGKHWGASDQRAVSVMPNAGLPILVDGRTEYPLGPGPFVDAMMRFVEESGVNIVGGCCGTTPDHIRSLVKAVGDRRRTPHAKTLTRACTTSLYSTVDHRQDASFLIVGERMNASGSRKFKELLEQEDWDGVVSLAREQLREGAHVLDLNVDYAGRDNPLDMSEVVRRLSRQVDAPLMIDSTQLRTIEAGLRHAGGKCVINSANFEDGDEKFDAVMMLAKAFNAGVVIGSIDEDKQASMARTAERKLAIAQRAHDRAVSVHGLDPRDLFFDPLVLPVSTGMESDRRSALETVEGVRRIAAAMPECQIVAGVSNVSFGLKPAARVALNSAFLHELREAGLTSAIVHASKILPRDRIPADQWNAALDLIYNRMGDDRPAGTPADFDPLQAFIALFTGVESEKREVKPLTSLTIEERLRAHIIDGEKKGLIEALEAATEHYAPLAIINDHLLDGMKTVGELFGSGRMQLPFVLQSAEVMKMAVAHLEPKMEKKAGSARGSIVLATVKGDVHDIGKNLVDIILSNNGFRVVNIGIKQTLPSILAAWREHKPDAIGLSGLLVKSVTVMEENIRELNAQGISPPLILGGAALTRHYCESHLRSIYQGSCFYGKDAFDGLRVMDLISTGQTAVLDTEISDRLSKRAHAEDVVSRSRIERLAAAEAQLASPLSVNVLDRVRSDVSMTNDIPVAPFFGSRVIDGIDLAHVFPFINEIALFRGQWQFKRGAMSEQEFEDSIERQARPVFEALKAQCVNERLLEPKVVYGYFPCNADGDELVIFDAVDHAREIERFRFPRQSDKRRLCISDYFRPIESGTRDVLGMHCVTVGHRAGEAAQKLFQANDYTNYLYLHGMGVETAEALAEFWHKRMRQELGIANDDSPRIRDLFQQKYRGSRYSFGYPACPNLADQEPLFRLLRPDRIGCVLTENYQIDPEQSTSAIIVHHPEAKYFNA